MSENQRESAVLTVAAWVEGPRGEEVRARLIHRTWRGVEPTVEYAASRQDVLDRVAAWLDDLTTVADPGGNGT